MARTKSHNSDEEKTKRDGIEPPYSAKVDGHRYVVYAHLRREGDEVTRILVEKFFALYAAQYFIKKLVGNDDYEEGLFNNEPPHRWKHIPMIVTSSGVKIMTMNKDLKTIMEYSPNEREREFDDPQLVKNIMSFKYGRQETETPVNAEEGEKKPKENRVKNNPVKEKPSKPKIDTSGYVSANDLAKQLKVEGREVRGVLRSLRLQKPDHGWSWPKKEADEIRVKVVAALHELSKKKKK